jgi:hypothetical protein
MKTHSILISLIAFAVLSICGKLSAQISDNFSLQESDVVIQQNGNYQGLKGEEAEGANARKHENGERSALSEKNALENITLYPNPTTGELQVTSDELQVTSIEIYDIYGRKQKCTKARMHESTNVIDISHLQSGFYFVKISTEKGTVVTKVIKK